MREFRERPCLFEHESPVGRVYDRTASEFGWGTFRGQTFEELDGALREAEQSIVDCRNALIALKRNGGMDPQIGERMGQEADRLSESVEKVRGAFLDALSCYPIAQSAPEE